MSRPSEVEIRPDKPDDNKPMEALNLNGNNSGGEDSGDSPTLNKYEYMSKNLSMRLNQMSSNSTVGDETLIRHDLFEIDRKRKLVTEELEALQRRRHEEFEAMKLLQERKNDLLKELNELQKQMEKEKGFMRQLEKEIMAKSRIANVPVPDFMRVRMDEQEPPQPQQNDDPQLQRQQLDSEVQHLKTNPQHDQHPQQQQAQQPDVLQHLTAQQQLQQLQQQQKEFQQLQQQKDLQQLREQQRQKELLQQRQQQEKLKQQQLHHQRQQQIQQQQQQYQQQKMQQRMATKTMDPVQQQTYPPYNHLPPPPPLGHMGRPSYFRHGVSRPPPPQNYLPHQFQGHSKHQGLLEAASNGASAQAPPQLHQARQHQQNFNQQQIHHKQVLAKSL